MIKTFIDRTRRIGLTFSESRHKLSRSSGGSELCDPELDYRKCFGGAGKTGNRI